MGCTTANTECVGPDLLAKHMPDIKREVDPQLQSLIDIPGMAKFLGLDIHLSLIEQNVQAGATYSCPDIIFSEEETCNKLYDSGPSEDKADILFIGAGFYTRKSLDARVNAMMDFESRQADTRYEGLFSIEPFKSNKHRFNVWTVPAGNKVTNLGLLILPDSNCNVLRLITLLSYQLPPLDHTVILVLMHHLVQFQ